MKLIVECSQKLVQLGENLWGKEQKLDKQMQEHQKLCDEIMDIQGIEPIEAEMEEVWHCPSGYVFKDENGNVINATKIVLEKKKKEYPKTYEEFVELVKKMRKAQKRLDMHTGDEPMDFIDMLFIEQREAEREVDEYLKKMEE